MQIDSIEVDDYMEVQSVISQGETQETAGVPTVSSV